VADLISLGVDFVPLLGWRPSVSICFLGNLSLLHVFHAQSVGFGFSLFAGSPKYDHIFDAVTTMQGILHVAQCCNIVSFISSMPIEF